MPDSGNHFKRYRLLILFYLYGFLILNMINGLLASSRRVLASASETSGYFPSASIFSLTPKR